MNGEWIPYVAFVSSLYLTVLLQNRRFAAAFLKAHPLKLRLRKKRIFLMGMVAFSGLWVIQDLIQ